MRFFETRKQKIVTGVVLSGVLLGAVCLFVFTYWYNNRCYEKYSIESKVERSDSNNVTYEYFNGNLLKYSRSGISAVTNKGKALWNGGYEMKQPQVDTCGKYVVVADVDGKDFYVFNGEDEGTKLETSLPIVRAKISRQGVVAVLLQDRDSNVLNIYNPYGSAEKLLVEIPTNVADEGYPIDFDLSPDGKSLVTAHMIVSNNTIENKVSFYNFSEVGQDKNTLVGGKSFGDKMVAKIEFTGDDEVVVFHESGYMIFEQMKQPRLSLEMKFDEDIKSIAYAEDVIAVVTAKDGKTDKQTLHLYNDSGREQLNRPITYEYSDMKIYGKEIIFIGNRSCHILRFNGHDKWNFEFEKEIDAVFPTSGSTDYTLIDSTTIQIISLNNG